ncbi:MAG: hypothetical protein Q8K98_09720 [Bacteroidota bacterium]|nr:hypothetical protein [Bacteroidota bacterium]
MFTKIFFSTFRFSLIILLTVSFLNSYSQSQTANLPKVNVTMIAESNTQSDLDRTVINSFKQALSEKGMLASESSDFSFEILVDTKMFNDKIVISVTTFGVIPPEVVSLGGKAEIFYVTIKDKQKENLTEEGKSIREYMSTEYMRQFRMINDNYLDVIDKSDLEEYCRKIVSLIYSE